MANAFQAPQQMPNTFDSANPTNFSSISFAMIKYPKINSLREERVIWPKIPGSSPSLWEHPDRNLDLLIIVKSSERKECIHAV